MSQFANVFLELKKNKRSYFVVALFCVSFWVFAAALSSALRTTYRDPPYDFWERKSALFEERISEIDIVIVGTSRAQRNIWPNALTQGAMSAGCPKYSVFNFGVDGMRGGEQDWLLIKLAKLAKRENRNLIFVIESVLPEANNHSYATIDRQRFFHSFFTGGYTLERIITFPEAYYRRLARLGVFVTAFAHEVAGAGLGSKALFHKRGPNPAPLRRDGGDNDKNPFRATLDQHQFDEALRGFDPNHPGPGLLIGRVYADKIESLRQYGIESFIVISPDLAHMKISPIIGAAAAAAAPPGRVLDFSDPIKNAGYYERSLWRDIGHLNRDGAIMLSREIGAKICMAIGS